MNWRRRTVGDALMVKGEHIQEVYDWYCDGQFVVNRKYQRKLVWELDEKKAFIDSILKIYPVPLFLLVSYKEIKEDGNKIHRYEIVDGLQRLDSIMSFIEGGFSINYENNEYYFDLDALPRTIELQRNGLLAQKFPKLPMEVCRKFANYQLALSVTEQDDEKVEEIFRRINSTGRKLSEQDLRQAGSVGQFTTLVRRISCAIRGDVSDGDMLALHDMQKYSLSNSGLHYGIDTMKAFWVHQQILTRFNMRRSQDEEIISYLLSYIIEGKEAFPTAKHLNSLYDRDSSVFRHVDEIMKSLDCQTLEVQFVATINELKKIFSSVGATFGSWCFDNPKTGKKGRCFQVVFLALYNLMRTGMQIVNYADIASVMKGIGDRELKAITSRETWDHDLRQRMVANIIGVLKPKMRHVSVADRKNSEDCVRFENILGYAKVEQQMYDFKQGVIDKEKFNQKCLERIGKTLVAMANTQKGKEGHVFIGVSNDKASALDFETHYNTNCCIHAGWYVNGVDAEALSAFHTLDNYVLKLKDRIKALPINDKLRDYVLRNMTVISYFDHTVIVLKVIMLDEPATYDGNYYIRNGSSTEFVKPGTTQFNTLMKRIFVGIE